jgi:hypothetical protein
MPASKTVNKIKGSTGKVEGLTQLIGQLTRILVSGALGF